MSHSEIEVRDLTYHYPDGTMALQHVSFSVETSESVGIVGPNGAGKSTLLLHLNGILPGCARYEHDHYHGRATPHRHSDTPSVRVAGTPVTEPHLSDVRRRVGLLFQDPDDQLFSPTVLEDVAFGPRNLGYDRAESREVARRFLAEVGLAGYEDRLPHHLSFGEKKRVCLAAVLACQPTILALDEPSSNLDPATRRKFMSLLHDLSQTMIVATHDLELVLRLCQRVILLDKGKLFADGPPREVLADEQLLTRHGLEMPLSLCYEIDSGGTAS